MRPFTSEINATNGIMLNAQDLITRRLSEMKGQYLDQAAYAEMLNKGDPLLYEVYVNDSMPGDPGELYHGTTILHPGQVGSEYFMTKGHFHAVLETCEVYYCLHGQGFMMMETPEGEMGRRGAQAGDGALCSTALGAPLDQ